MAGTTIRILERMDYVFGSAAFGQGQTINVPIARKIDTSQWREAVVEMRVHFATFSGGTASTGSVALLAGADAYTDEDLP